MIPWRGNLSFRVYSPDKPVKYGIKADMGVGSLLMFEVFHDGFVEQFQ
jgi:hypothetical protein